MKSPTLLSVRGSPQPQLQLCAEPEVSTPEHAMKGLSRSAYDIFQETHGQLHPSAFSFQAGLAGTH